MEYFTVGKSFNIGKIAQASCSDNKSLSNINIKNNCFLLIIMTKGIATFKVDSHEFTAEAPCFICFNESHNPILVRKKSLKADVIHFHPQFLNINMTFDCLRENRYDDLAHTHDMFLLRPFLDSNTVVPITPYYMKILSVSFAGMKNELEQQNDFYWSCRARSYFMEIIICLERLYGLLHNKKLSEDLPIKNIQNDRLRRAVLYIESNYIDHITLNDIVKAVGSNHSTLTKAFKDELGATPMEYLWKYRLNIAKKQLAFTEVPQKDIANLCGFKTVQHFARLFKIETAMTPSEFRKNAVKNRKNDFKQYE